MKDRESIQQIVQVARLYYEEGRTQEDIAKEVGISRPIISRLLKQAREEGIVHVSIVDPLQNNLQLAERLCEATGLKEVVVCPGALNNPGALLRHLGLAAADYLEHQLAPESILGVGWGRTLFAAAQAFEPRPLPNLTVVPLVGGLGQISPSFQVHEITRLIANACGGRQESFYVPALIQEADVKARLLASADVRRLTSIWDQITIALVGIGNIDFDSEMVMLFADYLDPKTRQRLSECQAQGDICMRFFNQAGEAIPSVLEGVMGIELAQLRQVAQVVGVAGGAGKAQAIMGAIRGRLITTLITDEDTAQEILKIAQ